jgi:hypothetical protein
MPCIEITGGILCISNIEFHCPHCNEQYWDAGERYLTKVNVNKCGYTKIRCSCGETFGMTYSINGGAVGFILTTTKFKVGELRVRQGIRPPKDIELTAR